MLLPQAVDGIEDDVALHKLFTASAFVARFELVDFLIFSIKKAEASLRVHFLEARLLRRESGAGKVVFTQFKSPA